MTWRAARTGAALLAAFALAACAAAPLRELPAPPAQAQAQVAPPGFARARFFGDAVPPFVKARIARIAASRPARIDVLALSGGADDGAYGAGLLKGWSARGDRPDFTVVTGVSTGALMAPFAFLGSSYDAALERFYTRSSLEDIVRLRPFGLLAGAAALGDPAPLRAFIEAEITPALLGEIATAHRAGRSLLIGTTNLDAQRPVIWDVGAIAAQGGAGAEALIETVLLASASVPGGLPPVAIEVALEGRRYQELHVDGGVTANLFAYPPALRPGRIELRARWRPRKTLWVVRNTKIDPDYAPVEGGARAVAGRAISTLIKYLGRGDILQIQHLAARDGFVLRIAAAPQDFPPAEKGLFDPAYMRALFARGERDMRDGVSWRGRLSESGPTRAGG